MRIFLSAEGPLDVHMSESTCTSVMGGTEQDSHEEQHQQWVMDPLGTPEKWIYFFGSGTAFLTEHG